jgi:hypothetical protein
MYKKGKFILKLSKQEFWMLGNWIAGVYGTLTAFVV